ncbi:peptidylprolyl isomerase [Deinococcus radiophilus]|nr:peptidylprolyl isomerase [Deinococcus radiophilus]UFA50598.1 peptidylprolyl isomerase [Deinococcus radiophilus]
MTARPRTSWPTMLVGGALALLGAQLTPAQAQTAAVPAQQTVHLPPAPGTVVAVIGQGEAALRVTRADFDRAFRLAVAELLNRQGLPLRQELLASFAPSRGQFFEQFVREKQIEYLARQALPDFTWTGRPRIGPQSFTTSEAYLEYLRGAGYRDEADYHAEAERGALIAAYRQSLQERFAFSDAQIESYYRLNRKQFIQRDEACVRHILVPGQPQARDLRQLLIGGGDFALLARTQSRDPGSAAQGGDLGCVTPGQTVPAFDEVVFSAALGLPQLVRTDHGWHVVEVTERRSAGLLPLDQAAGQVRQTLAREAAARYLQTLIDRVPVQSYPERVS